jgi:hypothetical protein
MMVENSKTLERMLFALAIILLIVAAWYADAASKPERSSLGPIAFPPADAACGFAIAGGLCILSGAIIHTKRPA